MSRGRIEASRRLANYLGLAAVAAFAALALAPLFHIVGVVALNGLEAVKRSGLSLLTAPPNPTDPAHPGGIGPALAGTAMLVAVAMLFSVLLAIPAGVFIAEFRRAGVSRLTMLLALILVEFPTVLVGLTVYAVEVERMVGRYNMLAGSLALAIVVLPYMAVQVSEALRHVPKELREAAFSLGVSRLTAVYRILVGVARRGILVGILIGMAKAAGETAPLLFTIGGYFETAPRSLLDPGGAVSLLIYEYAQQPQPGYHVLAWGAALVLLLIVFAIMIVARFFVREVRL